MWEAAVQTFHGYKNNTKGYIKVKVQGMPLYKASTQLCRAMHPKTNETNKILLESAGFVAKLATNKRIVRLKTHLEGYSTATTKNLYSHQDLSGQVKKTEAEKTLYVDIQW